MSQRPRFEQVFSAPKPLIAMIHTEALPGTPLHRQPLEAIVEKALAEARVYVDEGMDALLIENMHDVPYLKRQVGPEITAAMTRIAAEVRRAFPGVPLGIQILAGANREALAAALAAGADFIRAEGFVFGHVADEGWIEADAGPLMRYRRHIGAEKIAVFTDIQKKHASHAVTADIDLVQQAEAAGFFLSDGVIVTGTSTGRPPDRQTLQHLRRHTSLPVLIGSGVTAENLYDYFDLADAFIVGSYLKRDGRWQNAVDPVRVRALVQAKQKLMNRL